MRESHGALVGYEVSQSSAEEDVWTPVSLPPESFNYPIILNDTSDITVAVAARNPAGLSQPSTVTTPAYRTGRGSLGHFLGYQTINFGVFTTPSKKLLLKCINYINIISLCV